MILILKIKLDSSREIVKQLALRSELLQSRVDKLHGLRHDQKREIKVLKFNENQAIALIKTLKDQVEKLSLEKEKIAQKRLRKMRT